MNVQSECTLMEAVLGVRRPHDDHPLTREDLQRQNRNYHHTPGVSSHCREQGFAPAFLDTATGQVYLARYADGRPAPMHLLDGLPTALVEQRDTDGRTLAVKATVVAGFVQNGKFYTREQAACARQE